MTKQLLALRKIDFKLDLVKQAAKHVQFLEHFSKNKLDILNNDEILKKAAYRYEKCWLPFYLNTSNDEIKQYYPPFDVAWVVFEKQIEKQITQC